MVAEAAGAVSGEHNVLFAVDKVQLSGTGGVCLKV